MKPFLIKFGIVLATVFLALVNLSAIFLVTRASAANLAEPSGPDNPVNEYPSSWVVVVGYPGTLHMVNTASNHVYGPFLAGKLGSNWGVFDVAVTPNGKTALVSNFGDAMVSFVNISNPIAPSLVATVTLTFSHTEEGSPPINVTMYAEDIDITQNGKYALVTDGGNYQHIAILDIASHNVITGVYLDEMPQGVAIGPDGTVVVLHNYNNAISSYRIDDAGQLTYGGTYTYAINKVTGAIDPTGIQYTTSITNPWVLPKPINIGISPDGKTVILCNFAPYSTTTIDAAHNNVFYDIGAYQVTAPGVLSFTKAITGLTAGNFQSVAFSSTGDKAYLFGNSGLNLPRKPSHLTVLDITGPGEISLNNEVAAIIPRYANSGIFGGDSIAVINNKAYIGHETPSQITDTLPGSVHVVDLNSLSVTTLTLQGIPYNDPSIGVAAVPYFIYVPFLILQ